MKYFSFKILIIFFFLSGFSNVFSQEEKLEVYFDINEDGSAFSNTDEILVEYNIKNEKDEIIGSVILDSSMDKFQYSNLKKEIVATRYNFDKTNSSPFANKKTESYVRVKKSYELIFRQKWNSEKDRFDIFSTGNKLIGNISLSKKTGLWELYRIENRYSPDRRIFSNYFEINSTKANNKKSAQRGTISGRVLSNIGNPLPGVTVVVNGTSRGTTTDFDGNFTIKASQGEKLIISYVKYKSNSITVGSRSNYTIRLTPKIKKEISTNNKYGTIGVNISKDSQENQINSKLRLGADIIIGNYDSIGFTFGYKESDTLVSDEYSLSDFDFGVLYGKNIFKNYLKLKGGLGYEFYNYDVTESFGPFYDIGEGVYYSAGLQLNIRGFTLDAYYNNYGLGYGVGFVF